MGDYRMEAGRGSFETLVIERIKCHWDLVVGEVLVDIVTSLKPRAETHVTFVAKIALVITPSSTYLATDIIDPEKSPCRHSHNFIHGNLGCHQAIEYTG